MSPGRQKIDKLVKTRACRNQPGDPREIGVPRWYKQRCAPCLPP